MTLVAQCGVKRPRDDDGEPPAKRICRFFNPAEVCAANEWCDIILQFVTPREFLLLRGVCTFFRNYIADATGQFLLLWKTVSLDPRLIPVIDQGSNSPESVLLMDVLARCASNGCLPVFEIATAKLFRRFDTVHNVVDEFFYGLPENPKRRKFDLPHHDNRLGLIDIAAGTRYVEVLQSLVHGLVFYEFGWSTVAFVLGRIMPKTTLSRSCERALIQSMPLIIRNFPWLTNQTVRRGELLKLVASIVAKGTTAVLCVLVTNIMYQLSLSTVDGARTQLVGDDKALLSVLVEVGESVCLEIVLRQLCPIFVRPKTNFDQWDLAYLLGTQPSDRLIDAVWDMHPPSIRFAAMEALRAQIESIPNPDRKLRLTLRIMGYKDAVSQANVRRWNEVFKSITGASV